jgi:copper chaperone CopZ
VRSALLKLPGVTKADVTKKSAKVVIERAKVTDAQLIKAVEDAGAGYGATVAKAKP